jgi:hypothetical protein
VVDRDGDDVNVGRGDACGCQRDRADPSARTALQPGCDDDERAGEQSPCTDPDFGSQDAGLRREHEQQDDADKRHGHPGDGQNLADPAGVTRGPGCSRRRGRWGVHGGRRNVRLRVRR